MMARETPLLPVEDAREMALFFVVAALCFLASLAALTAKSTYGAAKSWTAEVEGELTVTLQDVDRRAAEDAKKLIEKVDGVRSAHLLSKDEIDKLLEPNFGNRGLPDSLPLPQLIAVTADPSIRDMGPTLQRKLTEAGYESAVDEHADWAGDVRRMLAIARIVALTAVALLGSTAVAVIAFATHAALLARKDIVDVLHLAGARDRFIASLFERRFWVLGLRAGAVGALLAGLAILVAVIVWQRRARLAERLALQAEARAQLERRVQERTAELAAVNRRLAAEVTERTAAEGRLRATQADLVQAGKLAALGQMSAALSHEFNQPLGAARNYAENAVTLIERGRIDEARRNIDRILGLIGRMGDLSRHLRNFARKPNAQLSDVPLSEPVAAARELLGWRLRAQSVTLRVDLPPLTVRAGPVRLQQVLVNILSNAIDAMEGCETRAIALTARAEGATAVLTIADTGPGIPAQLLTRIFDPFFSTKGVGKGLGLGLSISYNIVHDFGGTLAVANAPGGGAVFTLTLPLAGNAAGHGDP